MLSSFLLLGLSQPLLPSTTPAHRLNEDWWRARHEQKLKLVQEGGWDMIMIGDSITHGWEGAPTTQSSYFGDYNVLNLGYSGDQTLHLLWRFDNGELLGLSPKVCMVMIGTNNLGNNKLPDETATGIRAVVDKLHEKLPKSEIVLLNVFPRNDRTGSLWPSVDEVNEKVKDLDRLPYVTYLDIKGAFLDGEGKMPRSIMPDGLHPNGYGYYLWAKAVAPTLQKFLGKPKNLAVIPQPGIEQDFYDWKQRHAAVLKAKQGRKVDLVFIGDSITHMWGGEPRSEVILGQQNWETFYGKRNPLNLGFGWDRTQQVLWRLDNGELDGLHPKAVVIHIGTNNLSPGRVRANTDEEVVAGVRAVVDRVHRKCPNSKVILCGIFPRGNDPQDVNRYRIRAINAELAKTPGVRFVDAGRAMLSADGTFLLGATSDALHPQEIGYNFVANALEGEISAALGDTPIRTTAQAMQEIKRIGWRVVGTDSENRNSGDVGSNVLDGNPGSIWHTQWEPSTSALPHWIAVDMWTEREIGGFQFSPRSEGSNGRIKGYELYVASESAFTADGTIKDWGQPVMKGEMPNSGILKLAKPVRARFVKIVALSEVNGAAFTSLSEIRAFRP